MSSATPAPTSVNDALVGSSFPPPERYRVSAVKIAEFAQAVGATSPLHFDAEAARAAGYRDVVAPPTFAVVIAQRAEFAYVKSPESGIDFSRVVHAEESFEHHRPIVAGDVLEATCHVESITHRAGLSFVTTRVEISDGDGPVTTVISTMAVRGEGK